MTPKQIWHIEWTNARKRLKTGKGYGKKYHDYFIMVRATNRAAMRKDNFKQPLAERLKYYKTVKQLKAEGITEVFGRPLKLTIKGGY